MPCRITLRPVRVASLVCPKSHFDFTAINDFFAAFKPRGEDSKNHKRMCLPAVQRLVLYATLW
jgi:hypothetical protein